MSATAARPAAEALEPGPGASRAHPLLRPLRAAGQRVLLAPLGLWLGAFLLAPMAWMVRASFETEDFYGDRNPWSLANYRFFLTSSTIWPTMLRSLAMGLAVATICSLLGFAVAYVVDRHLSGRARVVVLAALLFPFLTSYIVRIFAWLTILGNDGIVNDGLRRAKLIDQPLSFLVYSQWATAITLTYVLLPITISTSALVLARLDRTLMDAAADLGASSRRVLWRITVPLARPGIAAGFLLVFAAAAGAYLEPLLVGGARGYLISNLTANYFTGSLYYERGAALSIISLVVLGLVLVVLARLGGDLRRVAGVGDRG